MLFFLKAHYGYIIHNEVQRIAGNAVFRYGFQRIEKRSFPAAGTGHPGGSRVVEPDISAVDSKCNIEAIATAVACGFGVRQVEYDDRFFAGI